MLVMRRSYRVQGPLCSTCFREQFTRLTAINIFLGWWGVISMFVTPAWLLMNAVESFRFYGAPAEAPAPIGVDPGTARPNPRGAGGLGALMLLGLVAATLAALVLIFRDLEVGGPHGLTNAVIHLVFSLPIALSLAAAIRGRAA
jgi:hypothetical protein